MIELELKLRIPDASDTADFFADKSMLFTSARQR
jgi:hypothetical protein